MDPKETIIQNLSKVEFVANALANHRRGDSLCADGMYFVLESVIEEIRTALEGLEERSIYTAANQAA